MSENQGKKTERADKDSKRIPYNEVGINEVTSNEIENS